MSEKTYEKAWAIQRAKDIVNATEWSCDMRVNMTTILGAGKVLARRVDELETKVAYLEKKLDEQLEKGER